jgi:glycosyltransferase involved in cell wall biosynthesis
VDTENRYTFVVDSPEAAAGLPPRAAVRLVPTTKATISAAADGGRRRVRDLVAVSRALSTRDLDVVLFPTLYSYVPTFGPARRCLIVHDATAEMFPTLAMGGMKNRLLWRAKTIVGRSHADVLLTVSEYSRDAISRHLGVPASRLHVVGEASDPVFRVLDRPAPTARLTRLGFDPDHRTIVYVGGFSPHKNLDALVRAAGRLMAEPDLADLRLFLVGDHARESFVTCHQALVDLVSSLQLDGRVTFTGFLEDSELVALLNMATVLALPSLTEGFGLPAIEAAACGCPVVATTASPLRDVLGEGARYVDPNDEAGLERTLADVVRSRALRARMRTAGVAAARTLTWEAAARRTLAVMMGRHP